MKTIYVRQMRFEVAKSHFLRELDAAFMSGETEIEVIHGVGTYALKNMIHEEASKLDYITLLPSSNPGVTRLEISGPDEHILRQYIE